MKICSQPCQAIMLTVKFKYFIGCHKYTRDALLSIEGWQLNKIKLQSLKWPSYIAWRVHQSETTIWLYKSSDLDFHFTIGLLGSS